MSQIHISNISLSFPYKICFENFTTCLEYGSRVAVVGKNGSGKSSLLKIFCRQMDPDTGNVFIPIHTVIGYVPQLIDNFQTYSGGQRFNKTLSQELAKSPTLLLLDEPTNHLDANNRRSLITMIKKYSGTLIIASHDEEFIEQCSDKIWHIENNRINVFTGRYKNYIASNKIKYEQLQQELDALNRQKLEIHKSLMKEQQRMSKSKAAGQKKVAQRRWLPAVANDKINRAEKQTGKKSIAINAKRQEIEKKLSDMQLPEVILPKFHIAHGRINNQTIIDIRHGTVGYNRCSPVVTNINLSLYSRDRIAICGNNASGKSTLVKAIMNSSDVTRTGDWMVMKRDEIGYLDQHYSNFSLDLSPLTKIIRLCPNWTTSEIRKHLSNFLFRKNEEVDCPIEQLSGGEKVRLSLVEIAAKTPKLLILDEITNNIDFVTRTHVIQVLKNFPCAMIVISHDEKFLQQINIMDQYEISSGKFKLKEI